MSIYRVLLATFCALLAGCGFHLRQQANLPPSLQHLHLELAEPDSLLGRDLAAALQRSGAKLATASEAGVAVLRLPVSQIRIETLSVGASARVREYTMTNHVEIEAVDGAGQVVLPRQSIELSRDYTFDETQAFGVAAQETELRKQLERDMVQAILRRLEALGHRAQ